MNKKAAYQYLRARPEDLTLTCPDNPFENPDTSILEKRDTPYKYKLDLDLAENLTWVSLAEKLGLTIEQLKFQVEWKPISGFRWVVVELNGTDIKIDDTSVGLLVEVPWWRHGPNNQIRVRLLRGTAIGRAHDTAPLSASVPGMILWEDSITISTKGMGEYLEIRYDDEVSRPCKIEYSWGRYVITLSRKHCPEDQWREGSGAHGALAAALEEIVRRACADVEPDDDDTGANSRIRQLEIGKKKVVDLVKNDQDQTLRDWCWRTARDSFKKLNKAPTSTGVENNE
jgi:hypothetical protein